MANQLIDNQKVGGGVVSTAGANTNVWYQRESTDEFSLNGSLNNLQTLFDWVLVKTFDSRLYKAGITKFCGNRKSLVVEFDSPFPSTDYFVFFTPNNNINTYVVEKKPYRMVINGSCNMGSEMSWIAIHKELAVMTGINNPGSIFAGSRTVSGEVASDLDITDDADANLTKWYNNELIIKPDETIDGFYQDMNLDDYSVILTSDENINMFWVEKAVDRVKVGTSYPASCTVDYFIVKSGINWWNEV